MSCESSEFEAEDDIELEAGAAAPRAADIRPYMYEPEESSGSDGGRLSQESAVKAYRTILPRMKETFIKYALLF